MKGGGDPDPVQTPDDAAELNIVIVVSFAMELSLDKGNIPAHREPYCILGEVYFSNAPSGPRSQSMRNTSPLGVKIQGPEAIQSDPAGTLLSEHAHAFGFGDYMEDGGEERSVVSKSGVSGTHTVLVTKKGGL